MGQALYRKYRSKSLSEIYGQEHITKTLQQALKTGHISHAYLLTGPHGVGKTSIARILAHEVNGLPYTDDSTHIDIIEIDAASNRRIDEIRELRDKVYVAPTSAKYKVYIIDEVHMLTREAFNALLKTLEEPPAHVIFILATTDAHKLPETIISRTQRFTFKPIEPTKVVAHLREIARAEHIEITDEALALLAEHGQGSFRDSISLLDQASNQGVKLDAAAVLSLLGIPSAAALEQLLALLIGRGGAGQLITSLTALFDQGYQAAAIAKQLGQLVRAQLIAGTLAMPPGEALSLLRELIDVPASSDPERLLEIILLKGLGVGQAITNAQAATVATPPAQTTTPEPAGPVQPSSDKAATKPTPPKTSVKSEITTAQVPDTTETATETPAMAPGAANVPVSGTLDLKIWPEVLIALKKQYNTLYGVARMAQPEFTDGGTLKLLFKFAFHQKRINELKNRQIITDIIEQTAGQRVTIECLVDKSAQPYQGTTATTSATPPTPTPENNQSGHLSTISNIFGGGELLES
jgi:DNA polymerase III subunit gamma/tau